MTRRSLVVLAVAGTLAACSGVAVALALRRPPTPHPTGALVDRRVPVLPLEDVNGAPTLLDALRGRIVVFAPFLTLCHELCPLTTGALGAMQRSIARAGLGARVVLAEVSVDPWRDTPARLRAFARLTGVRLRLFTGTRAQLVRFWRFFGVAFYRTKEDATG